MSHSEEYIALYRIRFCERHWKECNDLGPRDNWQKFDGFGPCGKVFCKSQAEYIEKPFTRDGELAQSLDMVDIPPSFSITLGSNN